MTTTKWTVAIGQIRDEISSDLLQALGYEAPYSNDLTCTARWTQYTVARFSVCLANAYAQGLRGDEAALYALTIQDGRRAAQALETARQKVAEIAAGAAADQRAAAGIGLAGERLKEKNKKQ